MSAFTTTTLTTNGINVMAKLVAGSTLEFTNIKIGDGALGSKNPVTMTALVHTVDTLPINYCAVTATGVATVQATFTNKGNTTGFFYRELGLFCKDPTTKKEVLFAYGNAGDTAEWIPPAGEQTAIEKIVNLETVIGNASKVTAQLVSGIYATTDQLTATLQNYATKTDLSNGLAPKANDNAVVHIAGTETVTGAKTFSAKITAPGGVQGNVTGNLTGTASKATADASGNVITTTYATKAENSAKATDSAVVHLAGTETVTGAKTFTKSITMTGVLGNSCSFFASQAKDYERGKSSGILSDTRFLDKDGNICGSFRTGGLANGVTYSKIEAQSQNTDGTATTGTIQVTVSPDGTSTTTAPTPADTSNTTEIATTAWARKNCVDLTSAQTITGGKAFTNRIDVQIPTLTAGTTPPSNIYSYFNFRDKNAVSVGNIQYCARIDGSRDLTLRIDGGYGTEKTLLLKNSGSLKWAGNEVLTTANGCDLASAQTVTGWKNFSGGIASVGTRPSACIRYTDLVKGDKPTETKFQTIYFRDNSGGGASFATSYGILRSQVTTDGDSITELYAVRPVSGSGTATGVNIRYNADGTRSFAYDGNEVLTTANGCDLASAQTITGAKTFNSSILANTGVAPALKTTANYGAELYMFPSTNTTYKGCIILRARGEDGGFKDLYIRSDGTLTWNGNNVLTTANGVDLATVQTITAKKTFTGGIVVAGSAIYGDSAVNDQLGLNGDKDGKGAYVSLCNKKHALNPGGFALTAYNGTDKHGLWGYTSGALTWDDKNLVRSINGVSADTSGNVKYSDVVASGTGYIRYSDGTQICYGEAMHMGTTNFPMPFVSKPYVTATHQTGDTNTPAFCITRNTTATSFIMLVRNTSGGVWATGAYGEYIAIGKWK